MESTACQESPPDTTLLRYTIHGDTVINGISYEKLCLVRGDTINPEIKSIGGLREVNKRIYYLGQDFLGFPTEEEMLLYDFTKQIGDTVKHDSQGMYTVILDIDSIVIDDNYRKRYLIDNHYFYHNPDYIIEGIGSEKWIIRTYYENYNLWLSILGTCLFQRKWKSEIFESII